ncbi:MAG TPA: DoxX family protein [Planctomycetaceae bacterium]|jgi:uncharacterized membrane protein|nr:DoxX family protein [Planctomycetaceae bacterium]
MRIFKTLSRYLFAIIFVGEGFLHFAIADVYLKIMPPYLAWHLTLVYVSGVAEILLGAMLMFADLQRLAGWGLILLLIAIFPANIYLYQHQDLARNVSPLLHLLRLPLQGVLILCAFWYTRPIRPRVAEPSAALPQET